jgi:hypothetical protein
MPCHRRSLAGAPGPAARVTHRRPRPPSPPGPCPARRPRPAGVKIADAAAAEVHAKQHAARRQPGPRQNPDNPLSSAFTSRRCGWVGRGEVHNAYLAAAPDLTLGASGVCWRKRRLPWPAPTLSLPAAAGAWQRCCGCILKQPCMQQRPAPQLSSGRPPLPPAVRR